MQAAEAENLDLAADLSLSTERLELKLREIAKVQTPRFTEEERAALGLNAAKLEEGIRLATSRWFRSLIQQDPAVFFRQVKAPVLALFGSKDSQVEPQINSEIVRVALGAAGNRDFEVQVLPGLNHFSQHTERGGVGEYSVIDETFSPEALGLIGDWIAARFLPKAIAR